MVVLIGVELSPKWLERIGEHLGQEAMALTAGAAELVELARRAPPAVLVVGLEALTAPKLLACAQVRASVPPPVTVYLAPTDVREQCLNENLVPPDFWLDPQATHTEVGVTLRAALQQARMTHQVATGGNARVEAAPTLAERPSDPETVRRMMSALAGDFAQDQLLSSYVDSAVELVRCSSHCLLWREDEGVLQVRLSHGLHPEIAARGRIGSHDALYDWYRQSSRVLTAAELGGWADTAMAGQLARELAVFGGQVALPLQVDGHLAGLLILGDKVVGEPYTRAELEALFALSGYVASQWQSLQAQEATRSARTHLEDSLSGINCGLLTLGAGDRVVYCSPAAGEILGVAAEQLIGADVRYLPAPLGDHLYAASRSPEAALAGEEINLTRLGRRVRVSTGALTDDSGQVTGSVMLLEDITSSREDRAESVEREVLSIVAHIVGQLAHGVRTPLTAVQTYAQLLSQAEGDEALRGFWEQTVRPELERLETLLQDQLRLLERPEPQLQLVSLEAVLREAVAEMCLAEPQVELPAVMVDRDVPHVIADPQVTREALGHLLRYLARRHGGATRLGLTVRDEESGRRVVVSLSGKVTESSVTVRELLEPLRALQKLDDDLGPAIGRRLIEDQGGRVEVFDGAGETELRVSFPVLTGGRTPPQGVRVHG